MIQCFICGKEIDFTSQWGTVNMGGIRIVCEDDNVNKDEVKPPRFSPIDLREVLEDHDFAYHVTSKVNALSIDSTGLNMMTRQGDEQEFPFGQVCFFLDIMTDAGRVWDWYTGYGERRFGFGQCVIYRIAIRDLLSLGVTIDTTHVDCLEMLSDSDHPERQTATAILNTHGVVVCCSNVPRSMLTINNGMDDLPVV